MAGQRAALRLLLLVVVATGVAGMHTLGHPGSRHGGAGCAPISMAGHQPVGAHADPVGVGEARTLGATGRGPPAVTPFGLAVADLSVLRT